MSKLAVTDFLLYRWRYRLSYTLLALLLAVILYVTGIFAPGGLSETEMQSVVRTAATTTAVFSGQQPEQLLYLPYRLLQNASFSLLGVSALSLKLPSLILAGLSALLFYGVLRLWFKRNVAVITTIILVCTEQFLLQSQQATPLVSYLFWSVLLLFTASMIAQAKKFRPFWLILTALGAGLAIYNPFLIYVIVALSITTLIHPHARFVVLRQPLWAKLVAGIVFSATSIPLVLTAISSPSVLLDLLGVPTDGLETFLAEAKERAGAYVNFFSPSNSSFIAPAYGLGTLLIALTGLYRLFTTKYTAKSYILTSWLIFTIIVVQLNPTAIGFTLLPVLLLVAFGIDYLIRSWYRLFPLNPYARFAGLLPLSILVVGVSFSGIERFIYGYHYDDTAASVYRNDVSLLNKAINVHPDTPIKLFPSDSERAFYEVYLEHTKPKGVSLTNNSSVEQGTVLIVGPGAKKPAGEIPTRIVVSSISESPNRFYLYETTE